MAKFYLVGGAVRDKIMGIPCKDMDYVVEASSFEEMRNEINNKGGKIFLESPEYLTIRAQLPDIGVADFVLPRTDGKYSDGRRPDTVTIGSLQEDLARRDMTMNAIAYDEETDSYIDLFDGMKDIADKIIRTVGDPMERFTEDSLRLLRAIRFAITKKFHLHYSIFDCLHNKDLAEALKNNVSEERKREELLKCFKYDTLLTIKYLSEYPLIADSVFNKDSKLWLMPTSKQ